MALDGTTGGPRSGVTPGMKAKMRINNGFKQLNANNCQCLFMGDRMPCSISGSLHTLLGPCGGIIPVGTEIRRGGKTRARNRGTSSIPEQSSRRRSDHIEPPTRLSLSSNLLESCSGLSTAAVFAMGYSRYHIPFQGALLSLRGKRLINVHGYS